jgi:hypothetical protein
VPFQPLLQHLQLILHLVVVKALAGGVGDDEVEGTAPARDTLLFGVATHKIGRILTKDWVTSPLRAPFNQYEKSTGGGEVAERSRGEGLQRATGDLLTCQWCIAPWVAASLYATYLIRPAAARMIAAASTSVAISDFLQHLYSGVKRVAQ